MLRGDAQAACLQEHFQICNVILEQETIRDLRIGGKIADQRAGLGHPVQGKLLIVRFLRACPSDFRKGTLCFLKGRGGKQPFQATGVHDFTLLDAQASRGVVNAFLWHSQPSFP